MYPKVLIGCPQSDKKAYCFDSWLQNVRSFTYPACMLHVSDNSETKDFSKYMESEGVSVNYMKPRGKSEVERIADSHNDIRTFALANQFDWLLHLESDIFPPAHIIEHLLAAHKSVIGALYHISHGYGSYLMVQEVEENTSEFFRNTGNPGKSVLDILDGGIHQVYHVGLGCVLIHRGVLERIKFRSERDVDAHPDSFFAADCYNGRPRIDIFADTSIICRHRNLGV